MNKQNLLDALAVFKEIAAGLAPGALGATVSIMTQTGLTWAQRFVQLAVGIVVSYYAGEVASNVFGLSDIVKNGVGFTAGIGAFEIVKHLRTSLGALADRLPGDIWETLKSKIGLGSK